MKEVFRTVMRIERTNIISIIIPIHNTSDILLKKCVESILRQTYKDIEVLLVDDGSTEEIAMNCDNIAKRDRRIKVFHQTNRGVSMSRNVGIEKSTGDYIMFVDSDDTIDDNMCSEMLRHLQKEKADVVISGYYRDYSNGKSEKVIWNNPITVFKTEEDRRYLISNMLQPENGLAYCWGKLFKKEFLNDNSLRLDSELSMGEDVEFSYRVLKHADNVCYLSRPLYHYFFNTNSVVRSFRSSIAEDYIKSIQILGEDLLKCYKSDRRICQSYYNLVLYHLLLTMINYSFHPQNPEKRRDKLKNFKKLCNFPIYKKALHHVEYHCFSITRAIPLFFIVHKMYVFAYAVAVVRHWQFKRRNKI